MTPYGNGIGGKVPARRSTKFNLTLQFDMSTLIVCHHRMTSKPFDLQAYFPFFLGTIANRWTTTSSKIYLDKFGIGIGEWRVLASIQAQGGASSQMVVNLISMDAGAVSRSMAKLAAEGLVEPINGRFAGRTKPYQLTDKGHDLYAQLLSMALEREGVLLGELDESEKQLLLQLMRKILRQIDKL